MKNKKIDLSSFDFNDFKTEAFVQLKSGQPLTGYAQLGTYHFSVTNLL